MFASRMGVEFDEATHTYTLNGEVIPSVTQILRFAAADLNTGTNPELRQAAMDRGTRVHEACLDVDFDPDAEIDSDIVPYVQAYLDFKRDYNIVDWIHQEVPVYGEFSMGKYKCAGTIDRYGFIDGRSCVLDIKTGSKVHYPLVCAQTLAYKKMLKWETNYYDYENWGTRCAVLHLKKDGKYTFEYLNELVGWNVFAYCLEINRLTNLNKGEYTEK